MDEVVVCDWFSMAVFCRVDDLEDSTDVPPVDERRVVLPVDNKLVPPVEERIDVAPDWDVSMGRLVFSE